MLFESIKRKLDEKIKEDEMNLRREEISLALTEEEKAGKNEEEIKALIESKLKEESDCDDKDDDKDDDEKDDDETDIEESLKKILSTVSLDEKVVDDLTVLFKVAVDEKASTKCKELSEKYENEFEVAIQTIEENLDKYLTHAAEEWLSENELEVDKGIKVQIAENFITGMRDLFVENYVDVPEDKIDLVAEAEETIDELNKKIDEHVDKNLDLVKQIKSLKAGIIISEVTSEMTDTQKEKLGTLIEGIEYNDDAKYREQVKLVIEKYFKDEKQPAPEKIDENIDDRMKKYLSVFKKSE